VVHSIACHGAVAAKPQYTHLFTKFVIGFDQSGKFVLPTSMQLTDGGTVSDDDIGKGLDWFAEDQSCSREGTERLGKIDPELMIIAARADQEYTSLVRNVVQNHPTYAAVNNGIMQIRKRQLAAYAEWGQKVRARLDTVRQQERLEHQQFMAEIGAVSEALATVALTTITVLAQQQTLVAQAQRVYIASHPAYVPAYRVTRTSCQWIGSVWSCSSY
jgi:hypothetical protein